MNKLLLTGADSGVHVCSAVQFVGLEKIDGELGHFFS